MTARQNIALFVLIVILYNTVGFIGTFNGIRQAWREHIRYELVSSVGKTSLNIFHFHKTQFKHNTKEFEDNGHWYDVTDIEIEGDSLTVYAFDDAVETQLVAEFHNILIEKATQDTDFSAKTKQHLKNFIKEFLFKYSVKSSPPSVQEAFLPHFTHIQSALTQLFLEIQSPPPEV